MTREQTIKCIRCEQKFTAEEMDLRCPCAPDNGPHESLVLPEVRRGFSLHRAPCPRTDPSPDLPPEVACTCREPA